MDLFSTDDMGVDLARATDLIRWVATSDEEAAALARSNLQEWINSYPAEHADEIVSRIYSGESDNVTSAIAELYLHWTLSLAGHELVVHPELPGTTKRVDFRASRDQEAYVEVRNLGVKAATASEQTRLSQIMKAIETVPSPRYLLAIHTRTLERTPSLSRIKGQVSNWLEELHDVWDSENRGDSTTWAIREYVEQGVHLEFQAIPRAVENFNPDADTVMAMPRATFIAGVERIRKRLSGKSGRYGQLNAPFVIVIVSEDWGIDFEEAFSALYGRQVVDLWIDQDSDESRSRTRRARDGFFGTSKDGPRNTRVSAVLFIRKLVPWAPELIERFMLHNPFAARPLAEGFIPGRELLARRDLEAGMVHLGWADGEE